MHIHPTPGMAEFVGGVSYWISDNCVFVEITYEPWEKETHPTPAHAREVFPGKPFAAEEPYSCWEKHGESLCKFTLR